MGGILQEDLKWTFTKCFSFVQQLYDAYDPYKRHDGFVWSTALSGSGAKRLLTHESDPAFHHPNMSGTESAIVAFREPRTITRIGLSQPADEIQRAVLAWQRELNKGLS